jgi:hypothetical protein
MLLDPSRFPLAAAYLNALPFGLESYPDCSLRSEVIEPFRRDFGKVAHAPGLPPAVVSLLAGPTATKRWVPEVLFQTTNLVIRDVAFQSDAAFFQWTHDVNHEIFDKPLLRQLMRLFSPTLIVVGAAKRWAAFHRGSTLTSNPVSEANGRVRASARLDFPEGLFAKVSLEAFEHAFLAALAGSRAKGVEVKLANATPTTAEYRVSFLAGG